MIYGHFWCLLLFCWQRENGFGFLFHTCIYCLLFAFFTCGEGLSGIVFMITSLGQIFSHTYTKLRFRGTSVGKAAFTQFVCDGGYVYSFALSPEGDRGVLAHSFVRNLAVSLLDGEEGVFAIPSSVEVSIYLGYPCTGRPTLILLVCCALRMKQNFFVESAVTSRSLGM